MSPGGPSTVRVSGFTIAHNAERLDFPLEASIRSILPLCDEVVVNVGRSEDRTRDIVRAIGDPRVRVLDTDWDFARGPALLREETLRAMRACRHPWGIYIQADEVLHEGSVPALRAALEAASAEPRVEGLVLRYRHIFGDPSIEAVNRRWYRREVRVVRLDAVPQVVPYRDAQGFRVGPGLRRVRARLVAAEMFHYGWLRSAAALRARREGDRLLYPDRPVVPPEDVVRLPWFPGLRPFRSSHPEVARAWVALHAGDPDRVLSRPSFSPGHLRLYLSNLVERATGLRPFEFRNYTLV